MVKCIYEHSLSIVIGLLYLAFQLGAWLTETDTRAHTMFAGHADDTFGALVVIIASKWFIERGSAQSK